MKSNATYQIRLILITISLLLVGCGSHPVQPIPTDTPMSKITPTVITTPTAIAPTVTTTPTVSGTLFPSPSPLPIATILSVRNPGGNNAQVMTVCLNVIENGDTNTEPVASAVERVLRNAGMTALSSDAICDGKMDITLSFYAIGAQYTDSYGTNCLSYTGADMSGNVKFSKSGMTTQHIAVRSHVDPALQIPNCSQASPSQANFDIWHGEILDALVQIWGPPILVHALSEPEFDHLASNKIEVMGSDLFEAQADTIVPGLIRVLNGSSETGRAYAADAFPDLGFYKGPKTRTAVTAAVPSLILLLSDPNTDVQRAAIRALGEIRADASPAVPFLLHFLPGQDDNAYEANFALVKITGKDFGFDVSQWELWWSTGK